MKERRQGDHVLTKKITFAFCNGLSREKNLPNSLRKSNFPFFADLTVIFGELAGLNLRELDQWRGLVFEKSGIPDLHSKQFGHFATTAVRLRRPRRHTN